MDWNTIESLHRDTIQWELLIPSAVVKLVMWLFICIWRICVTGMFVSCNPDIICPGRRYESHVRMHLFVT